MQSVSEKLRDLEPAEQRRALQQAMILCGLRPLRPLVEEMKRLMPVILDPLDNPIILEWYEKGEEKGREEGRIEGEELGRREESLRILVAILRARFGELPEPLLSRLSAAGLDELERLVVSAATIERLADLP